MRCENCGKEQPRIIVGLIRYREDSASHKENWCLECVQGKNPVRERFDVPTKWE
jgi:hypothetical protein